MENFETTKRKVGIGKTSKLSDSERDCIESLLLSKDYINNSNITRIATEKLD